MKIRGFKCIEIMWVRMKTRNYRKRSFPFHVILSKVSPSTFNFLQMNWDAYLRKFQAFRLFHSRFKVVCTGKSSTKVSEVSEAAYLTIFFVLPHNRIVTFCYLLWLVVMDLVRLTSTETLYIIVCFVCLCQLGMIDDNHNKLNATAFEA